MSTSQVCLIILVVLLILGLATGFTTYSILYYTKHNCPHCESEEEICKKCSPS